LALAESLKFIGQKHDDEKLKALTDALDINDAKSAFGCYLDVALEKGDIIKEPSHLMKTKRINITIPLYALEQID